MRLFLFVLLCTIPAWALEYSITTTWDDRPVDHAPVNITLSPVDESSFSMSVQAPFFNDPANPGGETGQPFYGLWEFEVVELFLLNDADQYVEIELCPWGQHIVLLLNGTRNPIRHSLPLSFSVQNRWGGFWEGKAIIPVDYLPTNVTKMNAYAIHGSGGNRTYEALYPLPAANVTNDTQPDFHRLELFGPIDLTEMIPANNVQSDVWIDSLNQIRRLRIDRTWDDKPTGEKPVDLVIRAENGSLVVNMSAPFYNDSAPAGSPGNFWQLWNYEVVELFLLNDRDEYVELEFGPHGHHLVLLLKGYRHDIAANLTTGLRYDAEINGDMWQGTARIPSSYLPPQVTKCNAYAIHGEGNGRRYSSLYPVPSNSSIAAPDFHLLEYFRSLDLNVILRENDNEMYSEIWQNAVDSDASTTVPSTTKSSGNFVAGSVLSLVLVKVVSHFHLG